MQRRTEVHLCWFQGGERIFAEMHRLGDGTWDAWLHPSQQAGFADGYEPPVRMIDKGISYEMALAGIFRAMGEAMPTGFGLNYL